MRNLLLADWKRMGRDKVFLLGLLFMLFGSVWFTHLNYRSASRIEDPVYVENVLFNLFPMIGAISGILIALYLGAEYDHGTIRNKLVVGHTRSEMFVSNLVVCTVASEALMLVMVIVSGVMGFALFREFLFAPKDLAYLLLCMVLITMAFASIYVGISMAIPSRAFSVVTCMVLFYAMMMVSAYVAGALAEQELTYSYVSVSQTGVEFGELIENPAYIDGMQRTIYEFIDDLLPTGQAAHMNNMEFDRVQRWPWLSALVWMVSVAFGWLLFRKRDIK